MDSSRGVNPNGNSYRRETTEENQQGASQSQPNAERALGQQLSRFSSGADLQTLQSSFRSLSVADSSVRRQQNPLLENRWTNGSPSSSSLQNQESDEDMYLRYRSELARQHHYLQLQAMMSRNDCVFLNGNSQDVPYFSRSRPYNGVVNNGSWRSNQGSQSLSCANSRMRLMASLAKDHDSSVELQRKISEGSKETIDVIFEGVIFDVCDLMVDRYGQHVLRKLMERCSSEQITQIVDVITQLQSRFVDICTDHIGALSVKSLLRCLQSEEQIARVVRAVSLGALAFASSGNALVILQCFKQFHPSHTRDLLAVIAQNCLQIATDEYGCRMLQQCLDTGCNVVKQRLIHEIIANALTLCVDSFGNYVVQYLVELGDPHVTVLLIRQLLGNYAYLARNKFASHVVQKFLKIEYINPSLIVCDLLRDIDTLLLDPFGNYVIQTAWFVCKDDLRMILMRHIDRNKPLMRCNMYGNKILERLNL